MLHNILTKITAKRLEKKFSQSYMASCLNISQSYYNKLENGKNEMSIRTMLRIIEILNIDIAELSVTSKKVDQNRRPLA